MPRYKPLLLLGKDIDKEPTASEDYEGNNKMMKNESAMVKNAIEDIVKQ